MPVEFSNILVIILIFLMILQSHFQKCITSLAWRPYAAGELAVGCEHGALVWQLDPNSQITRIHSQAVHLKQ